MPDILHERHIAALPEAIWPLLTTRSGLESWWTIGKTQVAGDPDRAGAFRFTSGTITTDLVVETIEAPMRLRWRCMSSNAPGGWDGTTIEFDLAPEGSGTRARFSHRDFAEDNDGFRRVTAGWSQYLDQLKATAEGVTLSSQGVSA